MNILAISGSLRSVSTNSKLLQAAERLAPDDVQFTFFDGLGTLPHFNPEIDNDEVGAPVKMFRRLLHEAGAVLICTPEYAAGVPGSLKNALDWIVSSGEFTDKPTATISASPHFSGGEIAHASLRLTLKIMGAKLADDTMLTVPAIPNKMNKEGQITDEALKNALVHLLLSLKAQVHEVAN